MLVSRPILASTIAGIVFLLLCFPISFSAAQTTCGPNERLSTTADIPNMGQLPPDLRKAGVCWNPSDTSIGTAANNAKIYLNSLPNKCVGSCQAPPDKAHIDKLNSSFAICAANFLRAYQQTYGQVSISSTFRCGPDTPATIQCDRTENNRAGGAPGSNHQTGLALDVNPAGGSSSYETMWAFAKANPQLGVCFPYLSTDRPHMALAGANTGESAKCAAQGIRQACAGSGFDPNAIQNPGPSSLTPVRPVATSPFQNGMQGLGSLFAPPQPQQCPVGYMMFNGQCLPSQAQAATQTTSPFNYGSPAPSPVSSGSSGSSASPSGSTGSSINIGSNVAANDNTGGTTNISGLIDSSGSATKGTTSSAFDLINAIANPTTTPSGSATGVTVGTSVGLNDSLQQTVALNAAGQNPNTLSASSTYALNPTAQQTFTSDDLSKTPVQNFGITTASTFGILENIKQMLLVAIQLLRPFGGIVPHTTVANATTVYME